MTYQEFCGQLQNLCCTYSEEAKEENPDLGVISGCASIIGNYLQEYEIEEKIKLHNRVLKIIKKIAETPALLDMKPLGTA